MDDLSALEPLPGGWSGLTFLGRVGGERAVVRIFPPDEPADAVDVQAALHRLVRGLVPVPEVLEVRRPDPAAGLPGLLVTEHLPGERGDLVLAGLDAAGRARLGAQVGRLAATLGGMPTVRAGRFDGPDLTIVGFGSSDGLPDWVAEHPLTGLTARDREALVPLADEAQDLLDSAGRTCLVHSDLNPKNLLVDPHALEVTGLVDWEFAHSGHPATDLGNALRFERDDAWTEAVLGAYTAVRGGDRDTLLAQARAADLWALVDLADRAGANPVADRALGLLTGIAQAGELGWTPGGAHA